MPSIKVLKARSAQIVRSSGLADLSSGPIPIVLPNKVLLKVLAEFDEIPDENLSKLNMDPGLVANILSAVYQRTTPLRPDLARLYDFDLKTFDRFPEYAGALSWAAERHDEALIKLEVDWPLRDEAELLRDALQTEVKCLVLRGVIDKTAAKKLLRRPAAASIAPSLAFVVGVIAHLLPSIEGKTIMTQKVLDRAGQVARELIDAGWAQSEAQRKTSLTRQRAYTKCVQIYNELRCAVVYVRRAHGDADVLAPSLYMLRPQRDKAAGLSRHDRRLHATEEN